MTEFGRKRFADSRYPDAFRLAEIKTHNLTAHASARAERDSREEKTRGTVPAPARGSWWLRDAWIPPSIILVLIVGALIALVSAGGSDGSEKLAAEIRALAEISPCLAMEQPPRPWPETKDTRGTHTARLNRS